MTSRGDPNIKLEYAFEVYDTNNTGYLDKNEIEQVVTAMFERYSNLNKYHLKFLLGFDINFGSQFTVGTRKIATRIISNCY